ncbi:hypothetical protein M758_7G185600 [Ceratodon purpureus]|nr:hypothetical protein M758_7G185600 [Ceratodon purpureus]
MFATFFITLLHCALLFGLLPGILGVIPGLGSVCSSSLVPVVAPGAISTLSRLIVTVSTTLSTAVASTALLSTIPSTISTTSSTTACRWRLRS